jgi:broad specificity phosphatase PhoE
MVQITTNSNRTTCAIGQGENDAAAAPDQYGWEGWQNFYCMQETYLDAALTDAGRAEAQSFKTVEIDAIEAVHAIDAVFSSPLRRALETADILYANATTNRFISDNLREVLNIDVANKRSSESFIASSFPSFDSGDISGDDVRFLPQFDDNDFPPDASFFANYSYESSTEMQARAKTFLEDIFARGDDSTDDLFEDQYIALSSHQWFLQAFFETTKYEVDYDNSTMTLYTVIVKREKDTASISLLSILISVMLGLAGLGLCYYGIKKMKDENFEDGNALQANPQAVNDSPFNDREDSGNGPGAGEEIELSNSVNTTATVQ